MEVRHTKNIQTRKNNLWIVQKVENHVKYEPPTPSVAESSEVKSLYRGSSKSPLTSDR